MNFSQIKERSIFSTLRNHRYGLTLIAFVTAAIVTGVGCVLFMRAFELVLEHRLDFERVGPWILVTTPVLFVIAVALIRRYAPYADGSGIPQVAFASQNITAENESRVAALIGARTLIVKVIALLLGLWAGASTGREGPTVQVAACLFYSVVVLFRSRFDLKFDARSAIVAGGAAGLAAAFNTPLAGVTFAIEELSSDYFAAIKDYVLMAIIFASIAAISLTGDYTYFGKLTVPAAVPFASVLLIGLVGGVLGTLFSTALIRGNRFFAQLRLRRGGVVVTMGFAWLLIAVAWLAGSQMFGPGNKVAQDLLQNAARSDVATFPLSKMAATLFTYWSGLAGGIFAPCLAIGASMGAAIGHGLGLATASCALIGMAAFLSGTVQTPITAFVIIFEMTGYHQMLVPVMLVSLTAFVTARLLKAQHLYKTLAVNYESLLK